MNINNPIPVRVTEFNIEQLKEFMSSFDHIFSDCDGVLWLKNSLPHVGEFFDLMKKCGKTVHFLSNSSLRSQEEYKRKFFEAGIELGHKQLTIPSIAIAEYLKREKLQKAVYCVTCDETINMLESYGFTCKSGPDVGPDNFEDYVEFTEDDPEIGAVVFDSDFKANLAKLHKAIRYLKRQDVLFACGATDRLIYFKRGISALGCSVFTDIAAVESERAPIILSKPSALIGECAMKRADVDNPRRVLFIGDMLDTDVGLGRACGFKTLLVLTNLSEETMMNSRRRPDYYAESLASMVPVIEEYIDYMRRSLS